MEQIKQVNVIGAGLAGLSAAVTLARQGVFCRLISSQPSERAQSVLAEGGINAALDTMGENDSPAEHFADTMRGGCFLESEAAVRNLTDHAPEVVRQLLSLGAPLTAKNGKLILRNFGGQKKKRTAYAGTGTGKILMTALIDEARKYEAEGLIRRYPHHELIGITAENGELKNITVRDLYTCETRAFTGNAILCTGGLNGFFEGNTTGTTQNTGNAAAIAFAAGVAFANLEMIQYHPTTVGIPGKRLLVSEAARGEGGRLFILRNGKPWYFMEEKYPALGNLMPRDVISREMIFVKREKGCVGEVCLDLRSLDGSVWRHKLRELREEIVVYQHIDPKTDPIPVCPGIHFFMGGVRVNDRHETNVKGLFAAGEAACKYHGANRLGGNSMLGAVYGGRVAAEAAAQNAGPSEETPPVQSPQELSLPERRAELREILLSGLGIVRSAQTLQKAGAALNRILAEEDLTPIDRSRAALGLAMLQSALAREESRGAHYREDFPAQNDAFRKQTVVSCENGELRLRFVSPDAGEVE